MASNLTLASTVASGVGLLNQAHLPLPDQGVPCADYTLCENRFRACTETARAVGTVGRQRPVPRHHYLEGSFHTDVQFSGAPVKIGGIDSSYPIFAHGAESRLGTRRALDGKLH